MRKKVTIEKQYPVKNDPDLKSFKHLPRESKTPSLCEAAVQKDERALKWVPEELKTWNICLTAVLADGIMLEYVPLNLRTEEICLEAVKQDGYALKFVPKKYKTAEICEAATEQSGAALEFIPAELITRELCFTAVQHQSMRKYSKLQFVPKELLSKELCLCAVEANPYELDYVPMEFRTYKVCRAAVMQIPEMIEYVPAEHQTTGLCISVFETAWNELPVYPVPDEFITNELRLFALQNSILAKEYFTGESEKFKLIAIKNQDNEVEQVEIDLCILEFCIHINNILGNLKACRYVPSAFDPEDLYITNIKTKETGLVFLPIYLQTAVDLNVVSQKLLKQMELVETL